MAGWPRGVSLAPRPLCEGLNDLAHDATRVDNSLLVGGRLERRDRSRSEPLVSGCGWRSGRALPGAPDRSRGYRSGQAAHERLPIVHREVAADARPPRARSSTAPARRRASSLFQGFSSPNRSCSLRRVSRGCRPSSWRRCGRATRSPPVGRSRPARCEPPRWPPDLVLTSARMRSSLAGSGGTDVPTPTPAARATSGICTSRPVCANASRAAARIRSRLRRASARSGRALVGGVKACIPS